MAAQAERGVPVSTLCRKYLHSNSTSHTWPFSAIAELIDNAYDPDVNAKQIWIDKTVVYGRECLSFMDNGNGLNHETMHKMLSFGYSDKKAVKGISPIGVYGNGFKSGSMRIGNDAIVFSKSKNVSCVGMLSQTYLKGIKAEQIQVPIISFKQTDSLCVPQEQKASLEDILRFSPFKSESELLKEINIIGSALFTGNTGTRIIIWNLRSENDKTELDFENDSYDIKIPSDVYDAMNHRQDSLNPHTPECVFSLRAYCSILYLKPRLQIVIRGQKVKSELIAKSLAYTQRDHYKPASERTKKFSITFGYNTKRKDQYGVMMYHKNRLIKAYERVGCQVKANYKGVGVIGVIECNFLEPTHNKQSFMENDKYRNMINRLGVKLEEYWEEMQHRKKRKNPRNTTPLEDTLKRPDQNWIQCDDCMKWRKLPDGIDIKKLPEKWSCNMNPDPQYRSCQVAQEVEDSDDEQPYIKTYKIQPKRKLDAGQTPKTKRNRVNPKSLSLVVALDNNEDNFLMEESSPPVNNKDQSLKRVKELCPKGPVLQRQNSKEANLDFNNTVTSEETASHQVCSTAEQTLQSGSSHVNEMQPISHDPVEELNTQQARLIELMTTTAEERDQYKEELQDLQAQVDLLKEEKAGLVLKCEELESRLQLTCASNPKPSTSTESHPSNSLVELRHNIGRLLVKHVPGLDLDLDQVNYECNVIDEILEKYLG